MILLYMPSFLVETVNPLSIQITGTRLLFSVHDMINLDSVVFPS